MSSTVFKFGFSEFTTMPWSFEQDVERYASTPGIEYIEICEIKLNPSKSADQVQSALDAGLQISSVQPKVRTLLPSQSQSEPKDPAERMGLFRETIQRLSSKTPGVPYVANTGPPIKGNLQALLDLCAKEFLSLAEFAADHGVKVAIEPLNPSIINVETGIWTLAQAHELVRAVDHPSFGICLDYWNIWQNAHVEDEIKACGSSIFLTQASDWRTPQSFQDRLIPGQGVIPLPDLLRATRESGYSGPYVVEIFSGDVPDSLWESNLESVLKESRIGMNAAWSRSCRE